MNAMTLRDQLAAADPASVHALVDAQPGLTPAESAFMRLYLLRDGVEMGVVPCGDCGTEGDR
jgi:hypothetical protein